VDFKEPKNNDSNFMRISRSITSLPYSADWPHDFEGSLVLFGFGNELGLALLATDLAASKLIGQINLFVARRTRYMDRH
jgi:hypothetical protein